MSSGQFECKAAKKPHSTRFGKALTMESVNDIGRFPTTPVQVANQSNSISKEVAVISRIYNQNHKQFLIMGHRQELCAKVFADPS